MIIKLQPDCLRWARERAGFTISELAQKMSLKEDKILTWEETGEITLSRAEKLANVTHIPFGYLFLAEPINEELPIKDFRTLQSQGISHLSVDLLDVVNDALQKQDWYRDYILSNRGEPLRFVGSLGTDENIVSAAEQIRSVVDWNLNIRTQASSWENALSRQIDAVEAVGILVMINGIVGNNTHRPLSVTEFRGFALSDNYAPLIFINGKDAKPAQIFTLAHELVHIWLGVSGVSNLAPIYAPDIDIERFCNAVAGELLIPARELRAMWNNEEISLDTLKENARHFRVSSLVLLRRLRDVKLLPEQEFQNLYADQIEDFNKRMPSSSSGGGNFYLTLRTRLGKRFASALAQSTIKGETTYREAFQLFGVNKAETIRQFASEIGAL